MKTILTFRSLGSVI